MTTHIQSSTLKFLKDLENNNNRDWFTEHKDRYTEATEDVKSLLKSVEAELSKFDEIEKSKLFRIYRDVRFSKDKTPYKTYYGGSFVRATAARRGGFYIGIQPGGRSMVAGGFWDPSSPDLKRMRQEISIHHDEFKKLISTKKFKELYGNLDGDSLVNMPRDFEKDDPAGDLLKLKQYLCSRPLTDKEMTDPSLLSKIVESYKGMMPFFDFMSSALTTNLDGESLI